MSAQVCIISWYPVLQVSIFKIESRLFKSQKGVQIPPKSYIEADVRYTMTLI